MKLIAQLCALAPSSSLAARALNYKTAQMTASMSYGTALAPSLTTAIKPLMRSTTRRIIGKAP